MDDLQPLMASVLTGHSCEVGPEAGQRDALSQCLISPPSLPSCSFPEELLQEFQPCTESGD